MRPVDRGSLEMATVSAEKVTGYHTNSAGYVDYIILNDVTADRVGRPAGGDDHRLPVSHAGGVGHAAAQLFGGAVGQEDRHALSLHKAYDKGNLLYDDKGDPVYEIQDEWYAWHLRSGSEEIDFTRATTYKGRSLLPVRL